MSPFQTRTDIYDFNDIGHRVFSATATFQKGIYHLFILKNEKSPEVFTKVLRLYQCVFQLCLTQLLLDANYKINGKKIQQRLRRDCKDPEKPTRNEIDPAAIVKHSVFEEEGHWKGFPQEHPLYLISKESLVLIQKIVEARHSLLYRPYMLDGPFWKDCTLMDLLKLIPDVEEIEKTYSSFIKAVLVWQNIERLEEPGKPETKNSKKLRCANHFLHSLFLPYSDQPNNRPRETLLLTYARILNPQNDELLQKIRQYRNRLLDVKTIASVVGLSSYLKLGEL
jgi:hypothetical protein